MLGGRAVVVGLNKWDLVKQEPAPVVDARTRSDRLRQELNRQTAELGRLDEQLVVYERVLATARLSTRRHTDSSVRLSLT